MFYLTIPLLFALVVFVYFLYLAVTKKITKAKMQSILIPGVVFTTIWVVIYGLIFFKWL